MITSVHEAIQSKQYVKRCSFCTRCSIDAQGCSFDTKDLTREDVAEEDGGGVVELGLPFSKHEMELFFEDSQGLSSCTLSPGVLELGEDILACRSWTRSLASALKDIWAGHRESERESRCNCRICQVGNKKELIISVKLWIQWQLINQNKQLTRVQFHFDGHTHAVQREDVPLQ